MGIYDEIAKRTGGDVYIGVVGPVRSGKSTFIKKFMELSVIPNIEGAAEAERARDELPQSAGGVTVMTSEPKFVPERAVPVSVGGTTARVRFADCVGYVVEGAEGIAEDGAERLVSTPWSESALPFTKAAELGTEKVITDHSTACILMTTDGTIGDIPRENYVPAEERCAAKLKEAGVPFITVLNSARPESLEAEELALSLEDKYGAPAALISCLALDEGDCEQMISMLTSRFPVRELTFTLPDWCASLPDGHHLTGEIAAAVKTVSGSVARLSDVRGATTPDGAPEGMTARVRDVSLGDGSAVIDIALDDPLFFRTLSEVASVPVSGRAELMTKLTELSGMEGKFLKYREAIEDVARCGYGVVMPTVSEMELESPEILKEGSAYGVRLRAHAPSVHLIRADIETEISPVVGTEAESSELVKYLLSGFDGAEDRIWETEIFGKSLCDLVGEGLHSKLNNLPPDARDRLSETLSRIVNDGADGLICILL